MIGSIVMMKKQVCCWTQHNTCLYLYRLIIIASVLNVHLNTWCLFLWIFLGFNHVLLVLFKEIFFMNVTSLLLVILFVYVRSHSVILYWHNSISIQMPCISIQTSKSIPLIPPCWRDWSVQLFYAMVSLSSKRLEFSTIRKLSNAKRPKPNVLKYLLIHHFVS